MAKSSPEKNREYASRSQAKRYSLANDVAPLVQAELEQFPECRERRLDAMRFDFREFCLWAFPESFYLPPSRHHEALMNATQNAVLLGGRSAIAMPRGSGKSTIFERALMWALLFGHRRFVAVICADQERAKERLTNVKTALETSDRLRWAFPRAIVPIKALERKAIRCTSQHYDGTPTFIHWSADKVHFPHIAGSESAGSAFVIGGITSSAVRGAVHTIPDGSGRSIRPDLVLIDDPQTRESAKSPTQVADREQIINADIMGMTGPGESMSALLACTVIYQDDLADRLLKPEINPLWQGRRVSMIESWPTNMEAWLKYNDIRENCTRSGDVHAKQATEFYREHREQMDAGAKVYWEHRKTDADLSPIQHAMNLHFANPIGFASEYQNEPRPLEDDSSLLTAEEIASKTNGVQRGIVPRECTKLVGFIDVQQDVLIWAVCGFAPGFSGHVVDYGTFPDQGRLYWEKSNLRRTYEKAAKRDGASQKWESALLWAIASLSSDLFAREWKTDIGTSTKLDQLLIDSKWGKSRELVVMACRKCQHRLTPSQGIYIGAASKPMSDYKPRYGETLGVNWRLATPEGWPIQCVSIDVNWWKSFVHQRWSTPFGERGSLSLFEAQRHEHQMFADHQRAEHREPTEGRGRKVDEWKQTPADNDYFDCMVGCHVAASMEGIDLVGEHASIGRRSVRTRVSAADALAQKRA